MSNANSVNWFEIYVQDMARARAFYEAVLQIRLEALKLPEGGDDGLEMWSFPGDMERYGANGALCAMPGGPSGVGGTLVYFACEDCGVTAARVAGTTATPLQLLPLARRSFPERREFQDR